MTVGKSEDFVSPLVCKHCGGPVGALRLADHYLHDNATEWYAGKQMDHDAEVALGICHFWVRNVQLLGYGARPNMFIPPGTVGDMEVIETTIDAHVLQANFYPGGGGHGSGLVVYPKWRYEVLEKHGGAARQV
jgi:hypothetical protein